MAKLEICPTCGNTKNNCICRSGRGSSQDRRCRYVHDNNVQCQKEGTLSGCTRGEGPWYCCIAHARASGAL